MTSPSGTQAVDRAARLLTEVVHAPGSVTFTELAAATGLAKSTTSRLLMALERNGLVRRDGLGQFRPGEVFVRSMNTFDTYYKNDASYAASGRGDYHTVGDVAYWDDEGYLYICDRKTDMIISGGMNIYPAEIEAALEQHPEIYDVAVFGIPSEEWGEVVHATVVRSPESSLTAEEIAAFAREHLASYKVPRSVDFTDELPRTGSGKILKRRLRAPYWAGRTAQVG